MHGVGGAQAASELVAGLDLNALSTEELVA